MHEKDSEEGDVGYLDTSARRYALDGAQMEKVETFQICTVQEAAQSMLIVLDSGAGFSLLPRSVGACGRARVAGKAILEDAPGGRLKTFGRKIAQVECIVTHKAVFIEEDFPGTSHVFCGCGREAGG